MRKRILVGNWKMNPDNSEAENLFLTINRIVINKDQQCAIVIAPPYVFLKDAEKIFHGNQVNVAAQDISEFSNGAHTGEVSASMLQSIGVEYCIIGHSERRQFHYETEDTLKNKIAQLLEHNIQPIFCCGETLNHRERGITLQVVNSQITNSLFQLKEEEFKKVVIAYEPVWAIGTGNVATPQQAQEVHAYIRKIISEQYGNEIAENTSILYGGSVNPNNALEIFKEADIDGGLVGGASLNPDDFSNLMDCLDNSR